MMTDTDQEIGQVEGRACTKCGEWKVLSEFNKKTKAKYGVNNECRACQRQSNRTAYLKNREVRIKKAIEYRASNPEKRAEWDATYRTRHPDRIKRSQANHYARNPDAWERRKETIKRWAENNPDKIKAIRKRVITKQKKNPAFRVNQTISRAIRASLAKGGKEGRRTFDILGYSRDDLMAHLESHFEVGMSWDNYGLHGWHIDHVIPKAVFNYTTIHDIDFKRCWALENLRPMWATENRKKWMKLEQPFQPSLALSIQKTEGIHV